LDSKATTINSSKENGTEYHSINIQLNCDADLVIMNAVVRWPGSVHDARILVNSDPIAYTCDVEKMFQQFQVNETHCHFLRFLWWKDGDLSQEPTVYRMKVHLFGATSCDLARSKKE
jgi:hypothetical protein